MNSGAKGWRKRGGGRKKMIDKETNEVVAMKLALEALNNLIPIGNRTASLQDSAIKALEIALSEREALAQSRSDVKQSTKCVEQSVSVGEPVAWRYKPVREDNPRWEYTTQHPLDMGDGYLRPSLVEYCKCIEPLYATEKPKLMLEKFREMKDLLEDTVQQEPATKEQIREAIVFNLPLYTTPYVPEGRQQRPSRSDMTWVGLTDEEINQAYADSYKGVPLHEGIEAKLREKNSL